MKVFFNEQFLTNRKKALFSLFHLLLFLLLTLSVPLLGQKALGTIKEPPGKILSFEYADDFDEITSQNSTYQQTNIVSLLGKHSLQWDWERGAHITLPLYNYFSEAVRLSPFGREQCLVLWIYNQNPGDGHLRFTVSGAESGDIEGEFYLNYTGWRTAHIPLSQMRGAAPQTGDYTTCEWLKIEIPDGFPKDKGRFFIDDVYTTMLDIRHPSADYQAPYVRAFYNGELHATQWMDQKRLPEPSELKIKPIEVSQKEMDAFDTLHDNEMNAMTAGFRNGGLNEKEFENVERSFKSLNIKLNRYENETYFQGPYIGLAAQGAPGNIIDESLETGSFIFLADFQKVLYNLAVCYHKSTDKRQKTLLLDYFSLATKAYLNSGWAEGSNMGALHHLGYSSRKIAPSFFMMKQELQEKGLLDQVSRSLNWYNLAYVVNDETHTKPDLDLFNTLLYSHYLASMMHPEKTNAVRHVKLFSEWMSRTFADDTGHGGFKHDGTAWHHWGHYPAYTNDAIDDAVIVTNKLSLAGFSLTEEGHKALQKAVKTVMLYSQGNSIPRSLSGRHPLRGSHKEFVTSNYVKTFVNIEPLDNELMQLFDYHNSDNHLSKHWTLPYSAMSLHRRKDYLAGVRGFSIYSWGAEIYNYNRFGRYQSYGTLDIIYKDQENYQYEGYDWNLNPGTTVTYLPLEELEVPIPIFMVKSLSRFANGVHDKEGKNGAHGFILDESVLINIDPGYEEIYTKEKVKAKKSTFFMDDVVLSMGTNISGQNNEYSVYTVVAQQGMNGCEKAPLVGDKKLSKYPYEEQHSGKLMLHDGKRNGYIVLNENSTVNISLKQQTGRGDESTFDEWRQPPPEIKNGKANLRREPETKGDFFTVTIDHGVKPDNGEYLYAVLPGVSEEEFTRKAVRIMETPDLYFQIISKKENLHAVRNTRNNTETYICYEAQNMIPHFNLEKVSEPCLIMFDYNQKDAQLVSVALPDLHQSAYSREQKDKGWSSRQHQLVLTFGGLWTVENMDKSLFAVAHKNEQTEITIKVQHGLSNHFKMSRI